VSISPSDLALLQTYIAIHRTNDPAMDSAKNCEMPNMIHSRSIYYVPDKMEISGSEAPSDEDLPSNKKSGGSSGVVLATVTIVMSIVSIVISTLVILRWIRVTNQSPLSRPSPSVPSLDCSLEKDKSEFEFDKVIDHPHS
jgi:hypothetical protein